jgi:hypothetical protein
VENREGPLRAAPPIVSLSPIPLAHRFKVTTFAAALHEENIACLLHGLTASIATPVSHPDLALLLVYGLTASITTPVSQYDGALFHT